jgi:hypothetical protein
MKNLLLAALALFAVTAPAADVTITSVTPSVNAQGINRTHTAGEALSVGNLVYRSATDLKMYKADANSATAANRVVYGICVSAAAIGAPVVIVTEDPSLTLGGSTITNGAAYILSATAGGLAPLSDGTTGWYVHLLGVGTGSTTLSFKGNGNSQLNGLRTTTAL